MKMKHFTQSCAAILLVVTLAMVKAETAFAQTVVSPSGADMILLDNDFNVIEGLNTACIVGQHNTMAYLVWATAFYDGTSNPYIYVIGATGVVDSVMSVGSMASVPDIAIGNNYLSGYNPDSDFIATVVFVNTSSAVEVDAYNIHVRGSLNNVTIAALSQTTLNGFGSAPSVVHVDVLDMYTDTLKTGFVATDEYMITWDTGAGTANAVVWADFYDPTFTGGYIDPQPVLIGSGQSPDISYVKTITHPEALITYAGTDGNSLYLTQAAMTSGSVTIGTPITLDDGTHNSTSIAVPRIDAIKDPAKNNSLTLTDYKVVAQVYNSLSGYYETRTYDNLLTSYMPPYFVSSDGIDVSGITGYSAPYNHYAPTVAFSATYNATIQHFTDYSGLGDDMLFNEEIGRNMPNGVLGADYYWVNLPTSGYSIDAFDCDYANSVSTPVADQQMATTITKGGVTAWAFNNGTYYEIDYKYLYGPPAFRQAAGTQTVSTPGAGWKAYPNPASNELTVVNAPGNDAATQYHIMDMAGRLALTGDVPAGTSDIDVSRLAPGTYMLGMYKAGAPDGNAVFVKN